MVIFRIHEALRLDEGFQFQGAWNQVRMLPGHVAGLLDQIVSSSPYFYFMGTSSKQSQQSCPRCLSDKTIRIILWGLPAGEPDPAIYTLGGCCVEEEMPEMECIDCGWQGSKLDVKKATRLRRFIWTDEDAPGIIHHRKFRITDGALDALETSEVWMSAKSFSSQFTPKSIYGPEGKMSWLWDLSWDSEDAMRSDLYTNMGGGVPIEIIDKLIQIIVSKNLKQ